MTVYNQWLDTKRSVTNFVGLDTDEKPTSSQGLVAHVSRFYATEIATACTTEYLWDGTTWNLQGFTPEEVVVLRLIARQGPPEPPP